MSRKDTETTQSYVELASQGYLLFVDAAASASQRTLGYWKSLYEIASKPQTSTAVETVVRENFDRANQIAIRYGQRLIARGKNITEEKLFNLVMAYPSHSFVIDRHEAKKIFTNVRSPTKDEQLFSGARDLLNRQKADICFYWDFDEEGSENVEPNATGSAPTDGVPAVPANGPAQ